MPDHLLDMLPPSQRGRLFAWSLAACGLLSGTLWWIDRPLRTMVIGLGPLRLTGTLAFEFACDPETAGEIIACWRAEALTRARFALGLDYLFMVAYALVLSLACLWARYMIRPWSTRLSGLGTLLASAVWLAAGADALENAALLRQLLARPLSPWPEMAYCLASLKYSLLALAAVFIVVGLMARLTRRG